MNKTAAFTLLIKENEGVIFKITTDVFSLLFNTVHIEKLL